MKSIDLKIKKKKNLARVEPPGDFGMNIFDLQTLQFPQMCL